jgi:hypothetical protein
MMYDMNIDLLNNNRIIIIFNTLKWYYTIECYNQYQKYLIKSSFITNNIYLSTSSRGKTSQPKIQVAASR